MCDTDEPRWRKKNLSIFCKIFADHKLSFELNAYLWTTDLKLSGNNRIQYIRLKLVES